MCCDLPKCSGDSWGKTGEMHAKDGAGVRVRVSVCYSSEMILFPQEV
jgi:hypothetical protein